MGVQLIANVPAPWNTKVLPPVTRNLEGWFTFDTDSSRFAFNRAPDKLDATIVGSPTAFPTHARFRGTVNYLQTQISDTDEVTLIAVAKTANTFVAGVDGGFIIGCHLGPVVTPGFTGNASGANLYFDHPTQMKGSASRDNLAGGSNTSGVTGTGTPNNTWSLRTLRAKSGVVTTLIDHTANVTVNGVDANQRVLTGNKYRIGSATAGFNSDIDVSFVGIHSARLTDNELALQVATVRERMRRLGITV